MDKNELKELYEKEEEYTNIFESFLNSGDEKTFSKKEVKKIIEAHIFKELLYGRFEEKKQSKGKNLLISAKRTGLGLLNLRTLLGFFTTYVFYVGFLIVIGKFLYPSIFIKRINPFLLGIAFMFVDRFLKQFLFIADLISFTLHKIGLVTLGLYSVMIYLGTYYLEEFVPFADAVIIALIVLMGMTGIDYLKKDFSLKTKYIDKE